MEAWTTIKDRVRYFNKWVFNRVTMTFAGRRHSPYTVVHHVGRKSGRAYATPVVTVKQGAHFIIPMPYGMETDWCRNVLAAEGCLLEREGAVYQAEAPKIIGPATALSAFPEWVQTLLRRDGTEHFLRLRRGEQVPPDDPAYRRVRAAHEDDTKVLMILSAVISSLIALGVYLRRKER